MKKKLYVIYKISTGNNQSYYVQDGVWSLDVNDSLFFEEKAGAEFVVSHILSSTDLTAHIKEIITNE